MTDALKNYSTTVPVGQLCRNCLYRAQLVELSGEPVMLA